MSKKQMLIIVIITILLTLLGVYFTFKQKSPEKNVLNTVDEGARDCAILGMKKDEYIQKNKEENPDINIIESIYKYSSKTKSCLYKYEYSITGVLGRNFFGKVINLNSNEEVSYFTYLSQGEPNEHANYLESRKEFDSLWANSF